MPNYSLTEFLEDDAVVLEDIPSKKYPKGHTYRFASPTFEVGLWLKNLIELGQRAALGLDVNTEQVGKLLLDDSEEADAYRRVMGDTFEQLRKDDVSWGHTQQVFRLLLKHWGAGQDIEVTLREAAGESVPGPNRQTKRAAARGSSPKAGSRSSRASSATKAPTGARASTRSRKTSEDGDTSQTA